MNELKNTTLHIKAINLTPRYLMVRYISVIRYRILITANRVISQKVECQIIMPPTIYWSQKF